MATLLLLKLELQKDEDANLFVVNYWHPVSYLLTALSNHNGCDSDKELQVLCVLPTAKISPMM